MGFIAAAGEFAIPVYLEKSKNIEQEIVQEQQKIFCGFSQASFMLFAGSTASLFSIPGTLDKFTPVAMAPLTVTILLMMATMDYKRMREQRAIYVILGAAKFGLLGAVIGNTIGCSPRMSLMAGAQGIAMWGVHSTMAYYYDW